jgi:radical SAM superfamily enzyme YgiQ (UPF0313 family)
MKILLINPPAKNELFGNNPPIIEQERGHNPPLGLLYLAGYLIKHSDFDVEVLDAQVENLDYSALQKRIQGISPDVVGITTMTFTLVDVIKTARIVKKINRDIVVILGGVHVNIYPYETINLPGIDFLVLGEGEEAFYELLLHLDDKKRLKQISGLVFKLDGEIIDTGKKPYIQNLDAFPFPARYITPYHKYNSLIAKRSPITTMITSRGCPKRCIFCYRPHMGKIFRARSPQNVVNEMEECTKMGIYEFLIYDDTFSIDRQRMIAICEEIEERGLEIGWDIRARVDTVDRTVLEKLKKANCERIHYGVESGSQEILDTLQKGITCKQIRETFRMTKEAGISTLAYFMLGCPGETEVHIQKTIELMKELEPDFVHITVFTPFPGTPIYLSGLRDGLIKKDYWREFAMNPQSDFVPSHWDEIFSLERINKWLKRTYREFYIRPSYIKKRVGELSSFGEFYRKAKAGLKVLRMK